MPTNFVLHNTHPRLVRAKAMQAFLCEVGHKLAELRRKKGYTSHEHFAIDYDIPRVQYWRLEKGRANFTIKTLMKILAIHDLTPEVFFASLRSSREDNSSTEKFQMKR